MLGTLLLLSSYAISPPAPAPQQDVVFEPQPARWRLLFGELDAPGDDLGLFGFHYDVLEPLPRLPSLYFGVGGWAALTGERGGLFTGGFTLGYLKEIGGGWFIDAGAFVGGGGGGGGSTNDGLMFRPHLAIERTFGLYGLRLEIADARISGTDLDDLYVSAGISLLSEAIYAKKGRRSGRIPDEALRERPVRITARVMSINPHNSLRTNGLLFTSDLRLIGIGLDYFLSPTLFLPLEAYGGVGGGAAGYAQALGGLGYRVPMSRWIAFEAKASVGSGGGGGIETGGGFLWSVHAALRAHIWRGFDAEVGAGYLDSPGGDFGGALWTAGISWGLGLAEVHPAYPREALAEQAASSEKVEIVRPTFELLHKIYKPPGDALTKTGAPYESSLNLVGVGIAWPLRDWIELTGRAFGAYDGDIGGYAEGFLGVRYTLHPLEDRRHGFSAAVQLGAGGGGGVDVGSGLLYEVSIGYRYRIHERMSFFIEAGKLESDKGSFEAEVWNLGLAWDLGLPVLR